MRTYYVCNPTRAGENIVSHLKVTYELPTAWGWDSLFNRKGSPSLFHFRASRRHIAPFRPASPAAGNHLRGVLKAGFGDLCAG